MAKKVITGEDFTKRNEEIKKKTIELEKEEQIKSLKVIIDDAITNSWKKEEYIEYIFLEGYLSQQDKTNLKTHAASISDWLKERSFFLVCNNHGEYALFFSEKDAM